jgi:hypothetical protein
MSALPAGETMPSHATAAPQRPSARSARGGAGLLVLALALGAAGCQDRSSSSPPPPPPPPPATPALQALALPGAPSHLAVGATRQLGAVGRYSDGTTAPVASGLAWRSSDPAVAAVDASGQVTALAAGTVTITASEERSGVSTAAGLVARAFVTLAAAARAQPGQVDTGTAWLRLTGLTPGAFYRPELRDLDDDVDLAVYADASLADAAELCVSSTVGTAPESCAAPANAEGELYLAVDGTWTEAGAKFLVEAEPASPPPLRGTVAFPADLPLKGTVDATEANYRVTGLTPGARYLVRLSGISDDLDLEIYADAHQYRSLCASYLAGLVEDACTATATAAGELFVEVDGESTRRGSDFTVSVTPL